MSTSCRLTGWARIARLFLLLSFLAAAGCSVNPLYKTTGQVMTGYAWSESTPYTFTLDDPDMACTLGSAFDPFVYSFKRVTDTPYKTGALMLLLSANCSEEKAWQAQLRSMRDARNGNVKGAQDARTEYRRWEAVTARRRLESYREAMKAYNYDATDPDQGCPYFDSDNDEVTFMMGLLTGTQAVMNDSASGVQVNVPRDIAPHAERAARCLSNVKWGGLPDAIRASVWLLLPDSKPKGAGDAWQTLAHCAELGIRKGMRAASAVEIVMAENMGRDDILKKAIQQFAQAGKTMKVWKKYRLVDAVSKEVVMAVSDRYWTQHFGERTPADKFGELKPSSPDTSDTADDLL